MAVPVPPDAVAACTEVVDLVRRGPLGSVPRWVHLPNLHLTLRFLGDTPPGLVPAVARAVAAAVEGAAAFDVELGGAGAFPAARKPRALWLGIRAGAEELGELAAALDPALAPLGWPPDGRPYRPHLTVARLDAARIADGVAVTEALRGAAEAWRTRFRAERVVLYRSHLGGGTPRHEPVLEVPLAERPDPAASGLPGAPRRR